MMGFIFIIYYLVCESVFYCSYITLKEGENKNSLKSNVLTKSLTANEGVGLFVVE